MHSACYYTLIESAVDIQRRIDIGNTGEHANAGNSRLKHWTTIWEIVTITTSGGLENLARRIQKFVFPVLKETYEQSELVRGLEAEGGYSSPFSRDARQ